MWQPIHSPVNTNPRAATWTPPLLAPALSPAGQVAGLDALVGQVTAPMVQQVSSIIVPAILANRELQVALGQSAGLAVWSEIKPIVYVIATAVVITCGVLTWRAMQAQKR